MSRQSGKKPKPRRTTQPHQGTDIEILEPVVEEAVRRSVTRTLVQFKSTSYAGIVPPKEWVEGYEQMVPGAADRFLILGEGQVRHRQEIERMAIASQCKRAERGQTYGLGICILIVAGGLATIMLNKDVTGFALILTSLSGIIGAFVFSQYRETAERLKKAESFHQQSSADELRAQHHRDE